MKSFTYYDGKKEFPYSSYLKTKHWNNKKIQLKKYCIICGTTKNLNIHHNIYNNLWRERKKDLICLCEKHHFGLHTFTGKFKRSVGFGDLYKYKMLMGIL